MTQRSDLIEQFLQQAGWAAAKRSNLAGDASNRRYERLHQDTGESAVLMDAPPDKGEDVRPFVEIAEHLSGLGLSAPRILAQDHTHGFLLLEDLGDDLFARVIVRQPELEETLYQAATDLLVQLHTHAPPADLPRYDPQLMTDLAAQVFEWYLPGAGMAADTALEAGFRDALQNLLQRHAGAADVLIQRDYHAENLLWLPQRDSAARVGLLDFQDGMVGHRAYDLVSVLEDARRDVPADLQERMLSRYIQKSGLDADAFRTAYAVLGAQRNLRIIGVFARLCVRDGKAHYLDLMPRVWAYLQHDLSHPALAELRQIVAQFPAPSAQLLERIRRQCPPNP